MRTNYNIAFCGDLSQNNGPANVNKNLIKYLKCTKIDTKSKNKVILFFKVLISLFKCKIFIFSSNYRTNYVHNCYFFWEKDCIFNARLFTA